MGQRVLRIEGLPDEALDAAATFHGEWLPKARALLDPPRNGEGDHAQHGGGVDGGASDPSVTGLRPAPPPRSGEDLVIVFPRADHAHRQWRLAAVQGLAREAAPGRVNGVVGDDPARIEKALSWLAHSPGITGQLLELARG